MFIYSVVLLTCQNSHPMCITSASFKVGSTAFYIKNISRKSQGLGEITSISYENTNDIYKQRSDGSFIIVGEDMENSFQEFFFHCICKVKAKCLSLNNARIMHSLWIMQTRLQLKILKDHNRHLLNF